MPEQFENGSKYDVKNSLQDFVAEEMYLHPKNRQKASKNVLFSSFLSVIFVIFSGAVKSL